MGIRLDRIWHSLLLALIFMFAVASVNAFDLATKINPVYTAEDDSDAAKTFRLTHWHQLWYGKPFPIYPTPKLQ